jgi:hypothetical protein
MKIISGGQTGADRAALDYAIEFSIPYGGWVPKGRKTEDGTLPDKYKLQEMPTSDYSKRTEKNILAADGTLIVSHGRLTGGSALTQFLSEKRDKPFIHVDFNRMSIDEASEAVRIWLEKNQIETLNVAGPRASKDPAIYEATRRLLDAVFRS